MKFHLPEIQRRVDLGLISCRKHPDFDLWVYNYTDECQYRDGNWDYYTRWCRGLVLDANGEAVALPFRKFFNFNEHEETQPQNLPTDCPEVASNEDGSLGLQFVGPDGQQHITTRGAFTSEQAVWATEWLRGFLLETGARLDPRWTYLFEIISPSSTYVVDYEGWDGLILIGLVDKETGLTTPYSEVGIEGFRLNLRTPTLYPLFSLEALFETAATTTENIEGWVLRYANGLMVKVKTDQYKAVFRAMMGLSDKAVWEALSEGRELVLPTAALDDTKLALERAVAQFRADYTRLETWAQRIFSERPEGGRRKDAAVYFQEKGKLLLPVLFQMLDGKDYSKALWKMLKPEAAHKLEAEPVAQ